jgi:hypothetical protein
MVLVATAIVEEPTSDVAPVRHEPNAAPAEQDVAMLAYALWQARGCPDGSPEQDWFHAESELKAKTSAADE